ncbi:MAG TPA: glutaminyl-peptide cyclotransferase [Ferruginibacter sp.]|nr:glutaminyl-peptide cyclotransferase [Ferruginibacter sp.]
MRKYSVIALLAILAACNNNGSDEFIDNSVKPVPVPAISYSIIAEYPHDTSAYTQGLEFHNGKLYEGTGDFETSSLRITDALTGKVEKKHMMGTDSIFGEGITIFNKKIYQLTWESNIVYVYDINNLDMPIKTFKWPYEGWGLTNNGTDLIISDGTANLYFVNPDDFRLKSTINVSDNSGPIDNLNELEYVDGFVYANIYQTDNIIKIDPASGHVVGKMEFPGLKEKYFADKNIPGRTDVLNGIAYDSTRKTFFITGKRWPKMFELRMN